MRSLCADDGLIAALGRAGATQIAIGGPSGSAALEVGLAVRRANVRPVLHLGCNASRDGTAAYLQRALDAGISDVLALPSTELQRDGEFPSVAELVRFVVARFGGRVRVAVCGFPWGTAAEGSSSYEEGLAALAEQART